MKSFKTFYEIICVLKKYWKQQNCVILQALDISVGAGTFHPKTFFGTIGSTPISLAYVQSSRRPSDGRYGKNPYRLQHYYQFQVIIKPAPKNIKELYLNSLKMLNIDFKNNDIRFIEDNWENPTLGAWGKGWEIWLNGMEITQFTYFQQVGGIDCDPITAEITYGLERLTMYIQNKTNIYDIVWNSNTKNENSMIITYGDLFLNNEIENSLYNFEYSNSNLHFELFQKYLEEANRIINLTDNLIIPAYENLLYAIHYFNLLDAKKHFFTTQRQKHILKIRNLSKKIATSYYIKNKIKFITPTS
ncbi:MAG: glycine--tRNA ligase subunit alpha [Buchnera aphidicola (Chaetogeoica yunlongensis)]